MFYVLLVHTIPIEA